MGRPMIGSVVPSNHLGPSWVPGRGTKIDEWDVRNDPEHMQRTTKRTHVIDPWDARFESSLLPSRDARLDSDSVSDSDQDWGPRASLMRTNAKGGRFNSQQRTPRRSLRIRNQSQTQTQTQFQTQTSTPTSPSVNTRRQAWPLQDDNSRRADRRHSIRTGRTRQVLDSVTEEQPQWKDPAISTAMSHGKAGETQKVLIDLKGNTVYGGGLERLSSSNYCTMSRDSARYVSTSPQVLDRHGGRSGDDHNTPVRTPFTRSRCRAQEGESSPATGRTGTGGEDNGYRTRELSDEVYNPLRYQFNQLYKIMGRHEDFCRRYRPGGSEQRWLSEALESLRVSDQDKASAFAKGVETLNRYSERMFSCTREVSDQLVTSRQVSLARHEPDTEDWHRKDAIRRYKLRSNVYETVRTIHDLKKQMSKLVSIDNQDHSGGDGTISSSIACLSEMPDADLTAIQTLQRLKSRCDMEIKYIADDLSLLSELEVMTGLKD